MCRLLAFNIEYMNKLKYLFPLLLALPLLFVACGDDDNDIVTPGPTIDPNTDTASIGSVYYLPEVKAPSKSLDNLILVCEGLWGQDNSKLVNIKDTTLTNDWFRTVNPGMKLGDTGNDIIQVNDTLIAISVNWSNIIQYIYPDGRAIAATEELPNNRKLATDSVRYLYCTSYADHGYVAKIDMVTKKIVATCATGYEPEGIAYYNGKLYIANTGGYSFQEKDHGYETTVEVIDAETMTSIKKIETGCINLYGKMSQCGSFICINSCGDYYDIEPKSIVLNMETDRFKVFDFPATYNCVFGNKFYVIGSSFSYNTYKYVYSMHTIDLPSLTVTDSLVGYEAAQSVIENMQNPYGIYISPYTGHLYVSDARSYATNAYLYEFLPDGGQQLKKYYLKALNPAHFLALP